MTEDTERRFVLTGGPGLGKTTLIEALAQAGHAGSLEAGRAILHGDSERRQDLEAPAPTTDPCNVYGLTVLSGHANPEHAASRSEATDRGRR